MKPLLQLILLLTVGIMSAGCSGSDEKIIYQVPEYEFPEGIYISTPEVLFGKSTDKTSEFNLAIYSSNSSRVSIHDLRFSTVMIYPVSKSMFFLRPYDNINTYVPALCLMGEYVFAWEDSQYGKELHIDGINLVMDLYYFFPGEGQYDFYLKFFMFDGYNYTTPLYRLTIQEDPNHKDFYSTNIITLTHN